MKITFICVGTVKKSYVKDGVLDYLKRIGAYATVESVDIKEAGYRGKAPVEEALRKEGERILKALKPADFAVVLADSGRQYPSAGFADFINAFLGGGRSGKKNLAFIVGGPYGLHPSVVKAASMILSLSAMTLPHDLARLVLAEQVYRAFTIIKNEPYSH